MNLIRQRIPYRLVSIEFRAIQGGVQQITTHQDMDGEEVITASPVHRDSITLAWSEDEQPIVHITRFVEDESA